MTDNKPKPKAFPARSMRGTYFEIEIEMATLRKIVNNAMGPGPHPTSQDGIVFDSIPEYASVHPTPDRRAVKIKWTTAEREDGNRGNRSPRR